MRNFGWIAARTFRGPATLSSSFAVVQWSDLPGVPDSGEARSRSAAVAECRRGGLLFPERRRSENPFAILEDRQREAGSAATVDARQDGDDAETDRATTGGREWP